MKFRVLRSPIPEKEALSHREVMLIAGETSGDLHAGAVVEELQRRDSDLRFSGIGGRRMAAAGVTLIEKAENLAVMGFVEVIKHIPHHMGLLRTIGERFRRGDVGLVVLVDYPGFNMRVARVAHEAGVPVLYYITPQVWAWGEDRLAKLAKLVTKAAVILPFEEQLLRSHGIDATFVGHPLLDSAVGMASREEARNRLNLKNDAPLLALFPGSRSQEIGRHLDDFAATAIELQRRVPRLQVVVSVASEMEIDAVRCPFPLVHGSSFSLLRAADAAFCKSGTTTLEAAVAGCPLVIGYRTSAWTYALARRVIKIPNIGLVNVVAGHEIVREFVQDALRPSSVADALEPLLDVRSSERSRLLEQLSEVRGKLGTPGAAGRVADMSLEILASNG